MLEFLTDSLKIVLLVYFEEIVLEINVIKKYFILTFDYTFTKRSYIYLKFYTLIHYCFLFTDLNLKIKKILFFV